MGERKDLRDLLRDTDFTQKRIIDDLANSDIEGYSAERGLSGDIRKSEGGDFIKNIFLGFLLVGIVVGSFWISFLIGKKVLVPPIKNLPTFEIPAPKSISQVDIEKATPVQEEPALQEREIKPVPPKPAVTAKKKSTIKTKKPSKSKAAASSVAKQTKTVKFYKVIVGTFKTAEDATNTISILKEKGFMSYMKKVANGYRVQAGAFDSKQKAGPLVVKLKTKGFAPTIIAE